jgi:xanthine dehydrogenase accessory factor
LTEDELGRLYGPIGLDLGARTPEETAISIVAEIIAGRWGGTGRHLRDTFGQIHESADRSLAALWRCVTCGDARDFAASR